MSTYDPFYRVRVNKSGVQLSALTAATPTCYSYYITNTPTCQVVYYNVITLYRLPSITSYRAAAAATKPVVV